MPRITDELKSTDKRMGEKINTLRILNGWSAKQLAGKIGVTHQQCRKYFSGDNRISASRLADFAKVFGKPITFFYEDIAINEQLPTQHQRMCLEVSRNFLRIKNPMHQNAINLLVRTLSENG